MGKMNVYKKVISEMMGYEELEKAYVMETDKNFWRARHGGTCL